MTVGDYPVRTVFQMNKATRLISSRVFSGKTPLTPQQRNGDDQTNPDSGI
jgi:hypothetical protein